MHHYTSKCKRSDFFQGHYKNKVTKQFKSLDGITETNDHAKTDIFQLYYQGVTAKRSILTKTKSATNTNSTTNFEIPQLPRSNTRNKKYHNGKSPKTNRHHCRCANSLLPEAFIFLAKIIQWYWTNPECNFAPWEVVSSYLLSTKEMETQKTPKSGDQYASKKPQQKC